MALMFVDIKSAIGDDMIIKSKAARLKPGVLVRETPITSVSFG